MSRSEKVSSSTNQNTGRAKRIVAAGATAGLIVTSVAACGESFSSVSSKDKTTQASDLSSYGLQIGQKITARMLRPSFDGLTFANEITQGDATVYYFRKSQQLEIKRTSSIRATKDGKRPLLIDSASVLYSVNPSSSLAEAGKLTTGNLHQALTLPDSLRVIGVTAFQDRLKTDKEVASSKRHHLVAHEESSVGVDGYAFDAKHQDIEFEFLGPDVGLDPTDLGELKSNIAELKLDVRNALDQPLSVQFP